MWEAPVLGWPLGHPILVEGQDFLTLDGHPEELERQKLDEVLDGELPWGTHHVRMERT